MRKKELSLIITFPSTADALAMERICARFRAPGRLIPVPTSITASCGLAWRSAPSDQEALETLISTEKLTIQGIYECMV